MSYWSDLSHYESAEAQSWMAHPLVRVRINERVSGASELWPTDWLRLAFADRLPLQRTVSIGCGRGSLERDLVGKGIVTQICGVDLSLAALEEARLAAAESGLSGAIEYVRADAHAYLAAQSDLDAVFFHASLHHFADPERTLSVARNSLRPGGLLYLDEYTGPSMGEWTLRKLAAYNFLYWMLPKEVRRVRRIKRPVNPEDPTEAIAASRILPAVHRLFNQVEQRDYGGNLVSMLYPNMQIDPPASREKLDQVIEFLLDLEDLMLRHRKLTRWVSFHSVVVATKDYDRLDADDRLTP
jgi:SAM-dependent methyltransferase